MRNDCSNEGHNKKMKQKFCQKNQNSPGFWKKPAMKAGKSMMKAEKIRNPEQLNLALIPCEEKLYFLLISWKYTTNEIYTQQRKRKNKEERIRRNPYKSRIIYIHIHITIYIYTAAHTTVQLIRLYITAIYLLQLHITTMIIFDNCNDLQHWSFMLSFIV